MEKITEKLFELHDADYKNFHCKLVPDLNPDTVIGVRVPQLRKLAKYLFEKDDCEQFFCSLPHKFYEENSLHAFMICQIKDFDQCIMQLNRFLPYVDNWATCDSIKPLVFSKHKNLLLPYIFEWINSKHTYTVRFGIGMLMTHYLDDRFDAEFLQKVADIKTDEYYINMMIAWYFATALAKQYEITVKFLEENELSEWIFNKTVQKAIESRRISDDKKEYLRTLRKNSRKNKYKR